MAQHPMHRSLNRHHLIAGGDMWAMFVALMISLSIWAAFRSAQGAVIAIFAYVGLVAVVRLFTKIDPHFVRVWIRSRKYNSYYPARSGMMARNRLAGDTRWRS